MKSPTGENIKCPVCSSTDSTRTLWFYLKNEVLGKKNKNKYLWFSPDRIIKKKALKAGIELTIPEKRYMPNCYDENKKLPGGVFDVIIFSNQLQFLKNDEKALAELRRLLRTGGFVLIQTIVNPEMDRTYEQISTDDDRDRLKKFYEPGIRSMYGINFHKHLSRAGFDVEIINYADRLGEEAIQYYQLGSSYRNTIFKCKKP
jgi:SAM-dependent methyltransferase